MIANTNYLLAHSKATPCHTPGIRSLSRQGLQLLMQQHCHLWVQLPNHLAMYIMLEKAQEQGFTFCKSNWFRAKKALQDMCIC
jgi:hypothetical protein